ncbi:Transcriptional regulator ATRX [Nymphon striatum]|nr:Transcriptional regulator ATRX [Nymphon striatum]
MPETEFIAFNINNIMLFCSDSSIGKDTEEICNPIVDDTQSASSDDSYDSNMKIGIVEYDHAGNPIVSEGVTIVQPEPIANYHDTDIQNKEDTDSSQESFKPTVYFTHLLLSFFPPSIKSLQSFTMYRDKIEDRIINCTSCGNQINHYQKGACLSHPALKVLICKKCYRFYDHGLFSQDENGLDEFCRWCAEGGNLICCDYCHNGFCKNCLRRNFGRKEISNITDSEKWKCYVCNPKKLIPLVKFCNYVCQVKEDASKSAKVDKEHSNVIQSRLSAFPDVDQCVKSISEAANEFQKQIIRIQKVYKKRIQSPENAHYSLKKMKILLDVQDENIKRLRSMLNSVDYSEIERKVQEEQKHHTDKLKKTEDIENIKRKIDIPDTNEIIISEKSNPTDMDSSHISAKNSSEKLNENSTSVDTMSKENGDSSNETCNNAIGGEDDDHSPSLLVSDKLSLDLEKINAVETEMKKNENQLLNDELIETHSDTAGNKDAPVDQQSTNSLSLLSGLTDELHEISKCKKSENNETALSNSNHIKDLNDLRECLESNDFVQEDIEKTMESNKSLAETLELSENSFPSNLIDSDHILSDKAEDDNLDSTLSYDSDRDGNSHSKKATACVSEGKPISELKENQFLDQKKTVSKSKAADEKAVEELDDITMHSTSIEYKKENAGTVTLNNDICETQISSDEAFSEGELTDETLKDKIKLTQNTEKISKRVKKSKKIENMLDNDESINPDAETRSDIEKHESDEDVNLVAKNKLLSDSSDDDLKEEHFSNCSDNSTLVKLEKFSKKSNDEDKLLLKQFLENTENDEKLQMIPTVCLNRSSEEVKAMVGLRSPASCSLLSLCWKGLFVWNTFLLMAVNIALTMQPDLYCLHWSVYLPVRHLCKTTSFTFK